MDIRPVEDRDLPALDALLVEHLDSSLFLLSNLETGGLEDHGDAYQGTWIGAFDGSRLRAVAVSCWNGMVLVQGDAGLEDAAVRAVHETGRAVTGIAGPSALVDRARAALGTSARPVAHGGVEDLFTLSLDALRVPEALAKGRVRCRPPHDDEIEPLLVDWRVAYSSETLGATPSPTLRDRARGELVRLQAIGRQWVLEADGQLVAYSGFNAWTRGVAQVGGVFTPRGLRGRGYGRAVVAGSLLDARERGSTRSVLFTDRDNISAQRAYRSLGYERAGEYGLVLFSA